MSPRRVLALLAALAGVVLIVVAVIYFVEPAKSLPSFIPGHVSGLTVHRNKRGVAALVVGLICLVIAWVLATRTIRAAPDADRADLDA